MRWIVNRHRRAPARLQPSNTAPQQAQLEAVPSAPTDIDYVAEAWRRMRLHRPDRAHLSHDEALKHPSLGPVLIGFAAALRREGAHVLRREGKA